MKVGDMVIGIARKGNDAVVVTGEVMEIDPVRQVCYIKATWPAGLGYTYSVDLDYVYRIPVGEDKLVGQLRGEVKEYGRLLRNADATWAGIQTLVRAAQSVYGA